MPPLCSSSEINLLVYHYLKESGFYHSCFSLRHEGRLDDEPLSREAIVEPGQLVRILQKGLLFLAVESHVNEDGSEKPCSAPFRLIGPPHVCDGVQRPQIAKRPRKLTPTPSPQPQPQPQQQLPLLIAGPSRTTTTSRHVTPAPSAPNGSHPVGDDSESSLASSHPANVTSSAQGGTTAAATGGATKRKAPNSPQVRKEEKRVRRTGSDVEDEAESSSAGAKRRKENGSSTIVGATPPRKKNVVSSARSALDSGDEEDGHHPSGIPNGRSGPSSSSLKGKMSVPSSSSKSARELDGSASPPPNARDGSENSSRPKTGPVSNRDANHKKKKKKGGGGSLVGTSSSNRSGRDRGEDGTSGVAVARVLQPPQPKHSAGNSGVADDDIQLLAGHSAEVFLSAWNPAVPGQIASGAGDATVRIWDVPLSPKTGSSTADADAKAGASTRIDATAICKHLPLSDKRDVSALDWNPDGTLLASGSYDGILRLWTAQGELFLVMPMHSGPIFGVQWNRTGAQILTASADGTAIVWDLSSGKVRQQFSLHSDSVLDVDWLTTSRIPASSYSGAPKARINGAGSGSAAAANVVVPTLTNSHDAVFATCSADNSILILRVGDHKPIKALRGHDDEVNAVRFDPSKALLASVSDDTTARLWSVDTILSGTGGVQASGTSKACLFTLRGHSRELYALEWAPTGPGSPNPDQPRMLATTSFDNTARLWNADTGACLREFTEHTDHANRVLAILDVSELERGSAGNGSAVERGKGATVEGAASGLVGSVSAGAGAGADGKSGYGAAGGR
ncbi:unnamed protein product [Tilletia controversa]|nr:unnamed protein product [Tilletia controversa]